MEVPRPRCKTFITRKMDGSAGDETFKVYNVVEHFVSWKQTRSRFSEMDKSYD